MIESRIDYLGRKLLKERYSRDDRVVLRPTKSNILKFADQSDFYDRQYIIDYNELVERIRRLIIRLSLGEWHFRKCVDNCMKEEAERS